MTVFMLNAVCSGCSDNKTPSQNHSSATDSLEESSNMESTAELSSSPADMITSSESTLSAGEPSKRTSSAASKVSSKANALSSQGTSSSSQKTGYISKANTKVEPTRTLTQIKSMLSSDAMKCDSYDLKKYTTPYWNGNIVYNESLNFIKDPKTGESSAPLLYNAAEILSVKNSKLNITYEEGIDYTYANGKITLTKNSRIHTFQYGDIYFNSGHDNNRWALKSGLGYKYTLFYEGTYFHENQISVTYLHSEPWTGFKPDYEGDNLPNVINKLKKGENVKIVYYGDSITKGGNASGMFGVAPNMPIWAEMVTQRLKQAYPKANITMYNPAENATDSTQGLKDCKVKVANQKPDLVIMGYGMNDGTNSKLTPAAYQSNIKMIREMVRALYSKQTDFILIATTLPNPEIKLGDASYQAEYESVLYELEQKGTLGGEGGTIVANMTKTHQELLKKKRFFDMTANNVNHPNDFLVRAQAQNVLSLLIENYQ